MKKNKELLSYVIPDDHTFSAAWSYFPKAEPSIVLKRTSTEIDWVKGSDINLEIDIHISAFDGYFIQQNRDNNLNLEFILRWYSPFAIGGTSLRGVAGRHICPVSGSDQEISVRGIIPGDQISSVVQIILELVVSNPGNNTGYEIGTVIWEDEKELVIEGDRTLFPTKFISFVQSPQLPNNALYYLHRNIENLDLNDPFNNIYTLLLNKDNDTGVFINVKAKGTTIAVRSLLNFIQLNVYREIMLDIVKYRTEMEDVFRFPENYDRGSVGYSFYSILNQVLNDLKTKRQKIEFL
jgi:hypothetical protein